MFVLKINKSDRVTNSKIRNKIVGLISRKTIVQKVNNYKSKRHFYTYQPGLLDNVPYIKITDRVYVISHKIPINKILSKHIRFYKIKTDIIPVDLSHMYTGYEKALLKAILLDVPVKNLTSNKYRVLSNYEEKRISRGLLK